MTTYAQPTEAVREYQKLQHLVNRRCEERQDLETKKFWINIHNEKTAEIASAHGLTIFSLIEAWENWVEAVDKKRDEIRGKA